MQPDDKKRLSIAALQGQDEARRARALPRDPNIPIADPDFEAACDVANFSDLQRAAAAEIARQIRTRDTEGAPKLTALGFGWGVALEIQRSIINGTHPSVLFARGIPGRAARNIAAACNMGRARFEAAQEAAIKAAPGHNSGRTFPRKDYTTTLEGLT
jgi:hypothetical protein